MVSFTCRGKCLKKYSSCLNIFSFSLFLPPQSIGPFLFWHSNMMGLYQGFRNLHVIWLMKRDCLTVPSWLKVHEGVGERFEQGIAPGGIGGVL